MRSKLRQKAYSLAAHLGVLNIGDVLRLHPARFMEWLVYQGIDPIGEVRADYRSADLMALYAESHRDKKRRAKPFSAEEFLRWGSKPPPRRTSWKEQKLAMKSVLSAHEESLSRKNRRRKGR